MVSIRLLEILLLQAKRKYYYQNRHLADAQYNRDREGAQQYQLCVDSLLITKIQLQQRIREINRINSQEGNILCQ